MNNTANLLRKLVVKIVITTNRKPTERSIKDKNLLVKYYWFYFTRLMIGWRDNGYNNKTR